MDQIWKKDIQRVQLTAECCANSQPAYSKQGDLLVSHLSLVFNLPAFDSFPLPLFPLSPLSRKSRGGLSKTYVCPPRPRRISPLTFRRHRTSKMLSSYILVGALAVMMASPSAGFHLQGMSLLHHFVVRLKRCAWSQRGQILSGGRV